MKTKFILAFSLFAVLFSSCKGDKKADSEITEPAVKENFNVELDVKVAKKDDFALYFTEDNSISFTGEKAVWSGVKGGNVDEIVKFELSEEIVPSDIRLDFGLNKDQEFIELKKIKLAFYGKEFIINGSDFFTYFIKEEKFKSEIDASAGSIKFIITPGNYQTPFYYPTQQLIDAIKKLTTEQKV